MNGTKDRKVKPDFAQYGFAHQENLIMACIGGSQAHGAKLGATDDTDWYGLYIPPPTKLLGLEREEHFLFAPLEFTTSTWDQFSARPELFLAKGHVKPFLGFADDQMKRLLGQKGQKNVHRAELEDKHGYDTKYAMHVIRLYGEAKELMEHGRITLPRPNRDELVEIRRGKYSLSEIRQLGAQLESEALAAQGTSPLPDKVDQDAISRVLADAHLRFWSESTN